MEKITERINYIAARLMKLVEIKAPKEVIENDKAAVDRLMMKLCLMYDVDDQYIEKIGNLLDSIK